MIAVHKKKKKVLLFVF